jgi:hypothetical protein
VLYKTPGGIGGSSDKPVLSMEPGLEPPSYRLGLRVVSIP